METEIKLAPVLPHQAALVFADSAIAPYISPLGKIRMRSEYFDTAEGELLENRFVLRLRRENERTVCTVKGPLDSEDSRMEIEVCAQNLADGIKLLLENPELPPEAAGILRRGQMVKSCALSFTRTVCLYKRGALEAEIAFDEGQTEKGAHLGSICELELELKSGTHAALKELAEYICRTYSLEVSRKGKMRQALELGEAQAGRAVNPFFVGAEMLNFCVRSKYIELKMNEEKQLCYVLTALGERELPARFGVSFDKPCAFAQGESEQ